MVRSGGGEQMELAESNAVVENVPATNVPLATVATVAGSDSLLSPADRKVASVLKTVLLGTYFLVLLLLLLYAAYRIRRWQKEVERRRQFKLKLEAMREKYSAQRQGTSRSSK